MKPAPIDVAAAPNVPHDWSVMGKTGAMLKFPAGAAEVVEAGQVPGRQVCNKISLEKSVLTCRNRVLDGRSSTSRGRLPGRGRPAPSS